MPYRHERKVLPLLEPKLWDVGSEGLPLIIVFIVMVKISEKATNTTEYISVLAKSQKQSKK